MKSFDVIVQRENGVYRATVPTLPSVTAEGQSRDEALSKAKEAIEEFFATAEVTTVSIDIPAQEFRPHTTPKDLLRYMALHSRPADDLDHQYWAEIEAESQRQRAEAEREFDSKALGLTLDLNGNQPAMMFSRSPRVWIETAGMFKGDEEAMLQHLEEIETARRREREEIEREYDLLEARTKRP